MAVAATVSMDCKKALRVLYFAEEEGIMVKASLSDDDEEAAIDVEVDGLQERAAAGGANARTPEKG